MLGIYYRIWVDCITNLRLKKGNEKNWKIKSLIAMSLAMMSNLLLFMSVLQREIVGNYFYNINFTFLPAAIRDIAGYLVLYPLPPILLNYLLIFRNNRYEILLERYPYNKGKLFAAYFITSMFLPIILLWIGILFAKFWK